MGHKKPTRRNAALQPPLPRQMKGNKMIIRFFIRLLVVAPFFIAGVYLANDFFDQPFVTVLKQIAGIFLVHAAVMGLFTKGRG